MRIATTLLCSVTAATIALIVPVPTSNIALYPSAQAKTNISISIGTFYDDLAPYGSWVYYQDDYVFVPSRIHRHWRPYTMGHWVYTHEFGWLWVSDEPFGWACYHYGRWGYSDEIGWFWLPGRRWAPAWVSWRRSGGYVVWAPIPPRYNDDEFSAEIVVSDIPDDYWVAVPSRSFLSVDLSVNIIEDDRDRIRAVHETQPVGNVTIQNNIVVNNAIDVDYVEKQTKQQVKPVVVKETDDPKKAGKGGAQAVAVFTGEVKEEKNVKPPKVKKIDEVKQEKAKLEEQAPAVEGGKKKKKLQTEQQMTAPEEAQPQQGGEQPIKKKKKAVEQPSETEAPAMKPKKGAPSKCDPVTGEGCQ